MMSLLRGGGPSSSLQRDALTKEKGTLQLLSTVTWDSGAKIATFLMSSQRYGALLKHGKWRGALIRTDTWGLISEPFDLEDCKPVLEVDDTEVLIEGGESNKASIDMLDDMIDDALDDVFGDM